MKDHSKKKSRIRRIFIWYVKITCILVVMATIDVGGEHFLRHPIFSWPAGAMCDGGTTMSTGPGYAITYWRRLDHSAYGPCVFFLLPPCGIDVSRYSSAGVMRVGILPCVFDVSRHGVQAYWFLSPALHEN